MSNVINKKYAVLKILRDHGVMDFKTLHKLVESITGQTPKTFRVFVSQLNREGYVNRTPNSIQITLMGADYIAWREPKMERPIQTILRDPGWKWLCKTQPWRGQPSYA